MEEFRYAQFCPVARAAEVLGHRWVLPILRELISGPQRFSDLRRRLGGAVSTSVLADRLTTLERQGIARRRELAPPAASVVYELTPLGLALEPAMLELVRWGARLLTLPQPGDHVDAGWIPLAARAFARVGATPDLAFELCATGPGQPEARVRGAGGPEGTRVDLHEGTHEGSPVDLRVEAPAMLMLGLISGGMPPEAIAAHPDVRIEGAVDRLAELPRLFHVPAAGDPPTAPRTPGLHEASDDAESERVPKPSQGREPQA